MVTILKLNIFTLLLLPTNEHTVLGWVYCKDYGLALFQTTSLNMEMGLFLCGGKRLRGFVLMCRYC